ncbi:MAG TPA: metallophosphoesterase family protein [Vicinamibacterales bacterium]|jgi:putative phosphoesterase|nr:metallophosphoesterase family protein [Vicinamibacterales bacterium]
MPRIAVLNDIHGNLPALEAVLADVRAIGVDRIVVGGDVFPGPMPHLVLDSLWTAGPPVDFIYGNGDVALLECLAGGAPRHFPASYRPSLEWNARVLSDTARIAVAAWPMTMRVTMPSLGSVLFCHATPRNENEIFTAQTSDARLLPIIDAARADLVVCGHTHMQFDRSVGGTRVVNAGSVGMPFGHPGADWLLLGDRVELRCTAYDVHAAAAAIMRSGYPGAEDFVAKYVVSQPSAGDMLALYAQHELVP